MRLFSRRKKDSPENRSLNAVVLVQGPIERNYSRLQTSLVGSTLPYDSVVVAMLEQGALTPENPVYISTDY